MNEQNASMDEILSSIRDIVKEEAGSIEAAAAPAAPEETPNNDDIEAMMAAAQNSLADDGEDVLELTETIDESATQASAEDIAAEMMAATEAPAAAAPPGPAAQVQEKPAPEPEPAPVSTPKATEQSAAKTEPVFLNAMPSAKGLQLAFPVEVLAEALRPLVKDWVAHNLPDIVERLVREELSRLVDKN